METEFKIPKNNYSVTLEVRCKDCFHFKKERANRYADICANLGILPVARPCKAFLANANTLSFKDEQTKSLAEIINTIPSSQLALIAGFINQEKTTRRQGFRHGQVVYVRLHGEDYLSNYAKAKVMMAWRGRVVVQGDQGFRGSFLKESIFNEQEFKKKEKVLIARKRINDPKVKQYSIPRIREIPKVLKDYEPPTIDSVIKKVKPNKNTGDDIHIRGNNAKA